MRGMLSAVLVFASASLGLASDDGHGHSDADAHHDEQHAGEAKGHGDDDHHHADDFADHKSELGGVIILHAWAQATDSDTARVFLEIENTGDAAVTLAGGDAHGIASSVTLMGSAIKAGGAPEALGAVEIAPGSEMELVPTGLYLALDGLKGPLTKGDSFEMHVDVAPLGEIEVIVEIEAANATQHSHAGHSH